MAFLLANKKRALPFGNARFCLRNRLARGARPDAFASRLRGDAKDGRSVATRVDAIGVADASFAETGRPGTKFSRESGFGAADCGANIEKSVSAPRRLSPMICWAPSRAKNSEMKLVGADSNGVISALSGDVAAVGGRLIISLADNPSRAPDCEFAPRVTNARAGIWHRAALLA